MAIVDMERITVVGLRHDRDPMLRALARAGVIDVEDVSGRGDAGLSAGLAEELQPVDSDLSDPSGNPDAEALERAREAAQRLETMITLCSRIAPETKKKGLSSLRRVSREDVEAVVGHRGEIWAAAEELQHERSAIAADRGQIARLDATVELLTPWSGIPLRLEEEGTARTRIWLGSVPSGQHQEDFETALAASDRKIHIETLAADTGVVRIAVVALREDEDEVRTLLKTTGFVSIPVQGETGTPDEVLTRIIAERRSLEESVAHREARSIEIAGMRPSFEILYDDCLAEIARLESATRLQHTRSTFVLAGWIPAKMSPETVRGLGDRFTVAVETRKPAPDENVPVLMDNVPLVRPYEAITTMFSTPAPGEIDPNPLMAPFFCVLFGLMVNDAGYGFLLALACGLLVWKFKVRGNLRSMCLLMFQGGIAAMVAGFLFGGFFGDIVSVVSQDRIDFPTLWFSPLENPVLMMAVSLGLGVVHVFTGMGAKAYMLIRDKKPLDALFDVGAWYMTLIGLGMLAVGGVVGKIGTVMAIAGMFMVVFFSARASRSVGKRIFKGLYNLYGITGYLSDILSYSRILALGLAGGVIAMVFNKIGSIAGFGIVGLPLFIVVALVGHTLNIALSLLGAYVHTSRLQYVEFFSKFFEGGGRPWSPLRNQSRYTEIKDTDKAL